MLKKVVLWKINKVPDRKISLYTYPQIRLKSGYSYYIIEPSECITFEKSEVNKAGASFLLLANEDIFNIPSWKYSFITLSMQDFVSKIELDEKNMEVIIEYIQHKYVHILEPFKEDYSYPWLGGIDKSAIQVRYFYFLDEQVIANIMSRKDYEKDVMTPLLGSAKIFRLSGGTFWGIFSPDAKFKVSFETENAKFELTVERKLGVVAVTNIEVSVPDDAYKWFFELFNQVVAFLKRLPIISGEYGIIDNFQYYINNIATFINENWLNSKISLFEDFPRILHPHLLGSDYYEILCAPYCDLYSIAENHDIDKKLKIRYEFFTEILKYLFEYAYNAVNTLGPIKAGILLKEKVMNLRKDWNLRKLKAVADI